MFSFLIVMPFFSKKKPCMISFPFLTFLERRAMFSFLPRPIFFFVFGKKGEHCSPFRSGQKGVKKTACSNFHVLLGKENTTFALFSERRTRMFSFPTVFSFPRKSGKGAKI